MKKLIVFLLMICPILLSCNKEQFQSCEKNCIDINVRGQVKNMETNKGISNVPVSISWSSSPFCVTCVTFKKIASTKTDDFGNYNTIINIDSSQFSWNKYIKVSIPTDNKNYLYYPDPSGNNFTTLDIDSANIADLTFEAYPKTTLKLLVKHPSNSIFYAGEITHSYSRQISISNYHWYDKKIAKDTIIKVETGAGVYTKVKWTKYLEPGKWVEYKDSIKCISGKDNVYEITF